MGLTAQGPLSALLPCFCGGMDATLGRKTVVKPFHRVFQDRPIQPIAEHRKRLLPSRLIQLCVMLVMW